VQSSSERVLARAPPAKHGHPGRNQSSNKAGGGGGVVPSPFSVGVAFPRTAPSGWSYDAGPPAPTPPTPPHPACKTSFLYGTSFFSTVNTFSITLPQPSTGPSLVAQLTSVCLCFARGKSYSLIFLQFSCSLAGSFASPLQDNHRSLVTLSPPLTIPPFYVIFNISSLYVIDL